MNTEQTQELWQVETGGSVFDTNFAEITTWINDGSLLRMDRVRKSNLRWIEAGKVPSLMAVFNAKENGQPTPPPVVTLTKLGPTTKSEPPASAGGQNVATNPTFGSSAHAGDSDKIPPADPVCTLHADEPATYTCGTCFSQFCKACPNSYGGSVKICPMCGAMCESLAKTGPAKTYDRVYAAGVGEPFGFSDFGKALAYPFKFKASLIMGAVMYMLFSIGQGAMSFGGILMLWGALACFLMSNTLTFGILANTVENFTQGKIGLNFMPTFDDFSIWDDVVHPFFLSIGVYIASFGPLLAVALVAFFMVFGSVAKEMNGIQSDAARTVNPELPYAANAVQQSKVVRELIDKQQKIQRERIAEMEESEPPALAGGQNAVRNAPPIPPDYAADESEDNVMRVQQMIQQQQKAQLESAVGKTPETKANDQAAMVKKILGYGVVFILLGGIALLWALFYFPAACAVAGYTRSFTATLNPSVGFDTIRHLGFDYVKILIMGLMVAVASGLVGFFLNGLFAAFNLPGVGNIPANALGSIVGFYFSVVFSCVLGFALYKASDRLKLPS